MKEEVVGSKVSMNNTLELRTLAAKYTKALHELTDQ